MQGRISRCGDELARTALYKAARHGTCPYRSGPQARGDPALHVARRIGLPLVSGDTQTPSGNDIRNPATRAWRGRGRMENQVSVAPPETVGAAAQAGRARGVAGRAVPPPPGPRRYGAPGTGGRAGRAGGPAHGRARGGAAAARAGGGGAGHGARRDAAMTAGADRLRPLPHGAAGRGRSTRLAREESRRPEAPKV